MTLVHYHKQFNIVCLDIKPENIFVGQSKEIRFDKYIQMDLGTALVLDTDQSQAKYITSFATQEFCS